VGRIIPEDPQRKFNTGITLVSFGALDFIALYAKLQPAILWEVFLAFEVPMGIGLIIWSRIQLNRENSEDFQNSMPRN